MSTPVQNNTPTKTKKRGRWQAVLLAGLMIAGTAAVPQAADAATGHKSCPGSRTCLVAINMTKPTLYIIAVGKYDLTHNYTVRTADGELLCRGRIQTKFAAPPTKCRLDGYVGRVRVTVAQGWHPNFALSLSDSYR